MVKPANKKSAKHQERAIGIKRMSFGRKLLVFVMSVFVAVLITGSLWVASTAIIEKVKISHAISQIIDVVDLSRRVTAVEHNLGAGEREDLLKKLAHMGQIQGTSNNDSLTTLTNPWAGTLVTFTTTDNLIRMETVVPARACERIINLLTQNMSSLGLKQIDAKGGYEAWRQIFSDNGHDVLNKDAVAAGCHSDQRVVLALSFTLR